MKEKEANLNPNGTKGEPTGDQIHQQIIRFQEHVLRGPSLRRGNHLGATWTILGPIVTSGRPPTPLDAGSFRVARYWHNLMPIFQKDTREVPNFFENHETFDQGTKSEPKGNQDASKCHDRKEVP